MKTGKRLFQLSAGVCLLFSALALQAEPLPGENLAGLLAVAKANNPELNGMRHELTAAEARVQSAGALPDPRLRTEWMDLTRGGQQSPTLDPSRVGTVRYTLMQEIPWFGKRDLKQEIASADAQAARYRVDGSWNELAARIKLAHAANYYLRKNELLTREILGLMVSLEQLARGRYASGLAPQQDVIRAQLEQTAMRNELIELERTRAQLRSRLNALLGRPAQSALAEPATLRPVSPRLAYAELEARTLANSPLLAAERQRIQGAEKGRDLAYRNRYPDLTLGVVPNQVRNEVRQWDFMLELNIPLQQASRRAQESEAEAMLAASQSRQEALIRQLQADLAENLSGLEATQRSLNLLESTQLPQAELGVAAALAAYETGKLDFTSVLEAHRQVRQTRQKQIALLGEAQVRLAEIERIVGEDL